MKHPQFILALDAAQIIHALDLKYGINQVEWDVFIKAALPALVIRQREHLDEHVWTKDELHAINNNLDVAFGIFGEQGDDVSEHKGDRRYLQLLPYVMFYQREDNTERHDALIHVYQRGKQVGESRLAGNNSIGYGGHIDLEDVEVVDTNNSIIDLEKTVRNSMLRELWEEVRIGSPDGKNDSVLFYPADAKYNRPHFVGLIIDNNAVGLLHIGLLFSIRVPFGATVEPAEDVLENMGAFTLAQLKEDQKLESWSKLIVDSFVPDAQ